MEIETNDANLSTSSDTPTWTWFAAKDVGLCPHDYCPVWMYRFVVNELEQVHLECHAISCLFEAKKLADGRIYCNGQSGMQTMLMLRPSNNGYQSRPQAVIQSLDYISAECHTLGHLVLPMIDLLRKEYLLFCSEGHMFKLNTLRYTALESFEIELKIAKIIRTMAVAKAMATAKTVATLLGDENHKKIMFHPDFWYVPTEHECRSNVYITLAICLGLADMTGKQLRVLQNHGHDMSWLIRLHLRTFPVHVQEVLVHHKSGKLIGTVEQWLKWGSTNPNVDRELLWHLSDAE